MTESKTGGKKRRWPLILGLFLGFILLVSTLLPTLLSTQSGKQIVLNRAAPSIPGTLTLEDWSLSWLGNQTLIGLSYVDPTTGLQFTADTINLGEGLSSLLLNRGDLGNVTIDQPVLQVKLPEPADSPPGLPAGSKGDQPRSSGAEASGPVVSNENDPAPIALPPVSGRLLVQKGRVDLLRSGGKPENAAKNINIELDVSAAEGPITYRLDLASPDGTGTISGQGDIQLGLSGAMVTGVQPSGTITVKTWPLNRLLDLIASYASVPAGNGTLSAALDFEGDLAEALNLSGTAEFNDVDLSGGPLKGDNLVLDRTAVDFSAIKRPDSVELSSLTLDSPLAVGTLSATPAEDGRISADADLSIDLPAVAAQLPTALNLQKGLQISGGVLALKASALLGGAEKSFDANASVEGLVGLHEGKKIALDEPFSFQIVGKQGVAGLRLDKLAVDSSFLNGTGSGDLSDLDISLNADLGSALRELSKFVSLQDYQAVGQIDIRVTATRKDEQTVELDALIEADKLGISQGKTTIIPQSPLRIEAQSMLALSSDFLFSGASTANLDYQSWLGNGSIAGKKILLADNRSLKSIDDLSVDTEVSFSPLTTMLDNFGLLPTELKMNGNGSLKVKLSGTDNLFQIEQFSLDAPTFSMASGDDRLIPTSPLNVSGSSELELGEGTTLETINNSAFDYATWLGSGTITLASFDVPSGITKTINYQGKTDLEKLSTLLTRLGLLPPELSLGGTETSSMTMDYSPTQIELASLHTEIDDFVLQQAGKTYRDKRLILDTAGSISMEKRQALLKPLTIGSTNADVSFEQLSIGDWNLLLDTLNSSGQARFSASDMLTAAADWFSLPDGVEASAQVDITWEADAQPDKEHRYQLSAKLSQANLSKNEVQVFVNEDAAADLNATRNPANGNMTIKQFALASSPIHATSSGYYNPSETQNTELSFQGSLAMDLDRLAALVRTVSDIEIEMAGKTEQPFQLAASFNAKQRPLWYQHATFNTVFVADLVKMLGVEVRSLEIPISLADGVGRADISADVNEGTLMLSPELDLISTPPLLTIPEDSHVIDRMQLSRETANQLLARIHPLFQGASEMSGEFDLDLASFSWPIGKEYINDVKFAGHMEFYEVRLRTSVLIDSLLDVMRVEDKELDLHERRIEFSCTDGRISTNALKTDLGDSELMISGSLGMDGTIDYLAQVPVTKQLVGGDLYDILEGTTINVPIGGTLAKPDISTQTVERAIADLARQAGQKKIEEAASDLLKKLF